MDIITKSVSIKGTTGAAGAIIAALCSETPSDAEKWEAIRTVRGELLAQTDYTMLPDAPPFSQEQVDEIAVYRQTLREIPQLFENPDMVVFPTPPSWL